MIDVDAFALMKPTAYLINVARGEVIVEKALYTALKEQRIDGAALDTWYSQLFIAARIGRRRSAATTHRTVATRTACAATASAVSTGAATVSTGVACAATVVIHWYMHL